MLDFKILKLHLGWAGKSNNCCVVSDTEAYSPPIYRSCFCSNCNLVHHQSLPSSKDKYHQHVSQWKSMQWIYTDSLYLCFLCFQFSYTFSPNTTNSLAAFLLHIKGGILNRDFKLSSVKMSSLNFGLSFSFSLFLTTL